MQGGSRYLLKTGPSSTSSVLPSKLNEPAFKREVLKATKLWHFQMNERGSPFWRSFEPYEMNVITPSIGLDSITIAV